MSNSSFRGFRSCLSRIQGCSESRLWPGLNVTCSFILKYSRLRVIYTFSVGMLHLLEMSLFAALFQEQSPGDSKEFAILRFHAGPPYEV